MRCDLANLLRCIADEMIQAQRFIQEFGPDNEHEFNLDGSARTIMSVVSHMEQVRAGSATLKEFAECYCLNGDE